jgi:YD repeat-containing protein
VPDKMYKLDVVKPVSNFQAMSISGNTINQDSRYRQLISFDGYDHVGNITQYTATDQLPVSILWDYKKASPIAQVNNADTLSIAYTSFEADGTGKWTVASTTRDNTTALTGINSYNLANGALTKTGLTAATTYIVSYWIKNTTGTISGYPLKGATNKGWTNYVHWLTGQTTVAISGTGSIDDVRLYPLGSQMTSYTYDPLVGLTSSTDAKNQVSYYEYDSFQRLMNVKDKDGNILKHVDYHYRGQ